TPGLPFTVAHPGRSTVTDTPRDPAGPAASGADTFMPVTVSRGYAFMAALLAFLRLVVTARTFSALVGPGVVFVEAGGLPGGGACGRGLRAVGQGLLVLFPPALPPRRRSWNGGGNRKIVLRPPGVGGRPSWAGRGRGQGIAGPWFRRGFRGRVVAFGTGARWCVGVRRRQGVSGEGSVVGGAGRAGLGREPGVPRHRCRRITEALSGQDLRVPGQAAVLVRPGVPGAGREERVFGVFGRLGAEFGGARARRGLGGPVLPGGGRGRGGRRPRSGLLAPGEGVLGGRGLGVGPPVGTGNRGRVGGVVVPGGRGRDGGAGRGYGAASLLQVKPSPAGWGSATAHQGGPGPGAGWGAPSARADGSGTGALGGDAAVTARPPDPAGTRSGAGSGSRSGMIGGF